MTLYGLIISTNVCCETNCRVFSYTLSMLEPYEVKVSRTVLRGLGTGNSPRLPDTKNTGLFGKQYDVGNYHIKTAGYPVSWSGSK
jgi:hypothetical protein